MKQLTNLFSVKSVLGIIKSLIGVFILISLLQSCDGSRKGHTSQTDFDPNSFITINMENDDVFFDSALNALPTPEYIVLCESDSIMFAGLSKLTVKNNKIFILDSWAAKTAVSFDQKGNPLFKYGRVGQGPGEYNRPDDMWVKDTIVYVLDENQKKVIRYNENGNFISESSIPFYADGFAVLPDNGFIFSISLDGESGPRICVTDSAVTNFKYLLDAPEGLVSGNRISNVFQETERGIAYYKAPLDTLFYFDNKGEITGGIVLDFGDKSIPEHTKLDYRKAWSNQELKDKYYLNNSPFFLTDDIIFSINMDDNQCNGILDKSNNKFGGKAFASENVPFLLSSINAVDDNNNLYGFTTIEYVEKFDDKSMPSDSIMKLLQDNPNIIIKYPFSKK